MIEIMEKPSLHFEQGMQKKSQVLSGSGEEEMHIIIVETHLLIREALQRVIGHFPRMSICASLSRVQDVPGVFARLKGHGLSNHVLLLGSSITISECLECTKLVQMASFTPGVVVIQQRLHAETAFSLIRSGVQGLLGEDASERDLARAIEAAASGNTFLGQRAREILANSAARISFHFTEREVQILSQLRSGISNFLIAQHLGLKEKTVEKHLTHIYEKLHIRSRAEAILRIQTLAI